MEKLKPCPISQLEANEASITLLEFMEDGVADQQKALSIAYKALYWIANSHRAEPVNKVLTLTQLKKMDGEPVWITHSDNINHGFWEICYGLRYRKRHGKKVIDFGRGYLEFCEDYDKTWLAYTHGPSSSPH